MQTEKFIESVENNVCLSFLPRKRQSAKNKKFQKHKLSMIDLQGELPLFYAIRKNCLCIIIQLLSFDSIYFMKQRNANGFNCLAFALQIKHLAIIIYLTKLQNSLVIHPECKDAIEILLDVDVSPEFLLKYIQMTGIQTKIKYLEHQQKDDCLLRVLFDGLHAIDQRKFLVGAIRLVKYDILSVLLPMKFDFQLFFCIIRHYNPQLINLIKKRWQLNQLQYFAIFMLEAHEVKEISCFFNNDDRCSCILNPNDFYNHHDVGRITNIAIRYREMPIIQWIIETKFGHNHYVQSYNPLWTAIELGHLDMVQSFIHFYDSTQYRNNIIDFAVTYDRHLIVEWLFQYDKNIFVGSDLDRVLFFAIVNQSYEIILWMIKNHKQIFTSKHVRESASKCLQPNFLGMIIQIVPHAQLQVLQCVIQEGYLAGVQKLYSDKFPVLHYACYYGQVDIVQWAIETMKINPNEKRILIDEDFHMNNIDFSVANTAFGFATLAKHVHVCQLLLENHHMQIQPEELGVAIPKLLEQGHFALANLFFRHGAMILDDGLLSNISFATRQHFIDGLQSRYEFLLAKTSVFYTKSIISLIVGFLVSWNVFADHLIIYF
jgi:hypothetical protein